MRELRGNVLNSNGFTESIELRSYKLTYGRAVEKGLQPGENTFCVISRNGRSTCLSQLKPVYELSGANTAAEKSPIRVIPEYGP